MQIELVKLKKETKKKLDAKEMSGFGAIKEILTKFPKADKNVVYATLMKSGFTPTYNSVLSMMVRVKGELKAKKILKGEGYRWI